MIEHRRDAVVPGASAYESSLSLDDTLDATETSREATGADEAAAPPQRVGPFAIEGELGAGSMGVIYLGHDPQLERRVAVKVLRQREASSDDRERMLREARALARLTHPNVVRVYASGEHERGVYIAMELVEGGTLGAWRSAAPRQLDEILDVFMDAGRGLAAMHRKGLIHRDFKPDNVMIDDEGRVLVMDLGLVRSADEASTAAAAQAQLAPAQTAPVRTVTGAVMGTPAYMAPEQHLGAPADARSDQFSFGVALWEALYEERPFSGQTMAELAARVTSGELELPRDRKGVPAGVHAALSRALSRDPAQRWGSIERLLEALEDEREELPTRLAQLRTRALLSVGLLSFGALSLGVGLVAMGISLWIMSSIELEGSGTWLHTLTGMPLVALVLARVLVRLRRYWRAIRDGLGGASRTRADLRAQCIELLELQLDGWTNAWAKLAMFALFPLVTLELLHIVVLMLNKHGAASVQLIVYITLAVLLSLTPIYAWGSAIPRLRAQLERLRRAPGPARDQPASACSRTTARGRRLA